MGWFDLVNFTLQIDDENDEIRRRARMARSSLPAAPLSAPTQQLSSRL